MKDRIIKSKHMSAFSCIPVVTLVLVLTGCAAPSLSIPLLHKSQDPTPPHVGKLSSHLGHKHFRLKSSKHQKQRPGAMHHVAPRSSWPRSYAAQLVPVLDASVHTFDQASAAIATTTDLSAAGSICSDYGNQISLLAARADGVPHPYLWYTRVGSLHHRVMGVYHYMLGALQQCQTASDTQDSAEAASSIADVAAAAGQLHQLSNQSHALARGR